MAELIAHEIKISFAGQAEGDQPDHLVQRDAAVDDHGLAGLVHVPVHFLVHQPERDRLVADQRLVVALGIADVLFAESAIHQRVINLAQVPVFVGFFFEQLDPVIGHAHRQAIIETEPAFVDRPRHADHAADIFGDGDRVGLDVVDELLASCR